MVDDHPFEIYHRVQMHCKVSLTQFSQFAWNIWMKSNKEKFSNQIWRSIFVKEIPPDQRLHALDAQYRNQRDWSPEVQKVKQNSLNVPIISKTLSCLRWQRKLIFCLKPKSNIKTQLSKAKTFLCHISKMNPFLVMHNSHKTYLRILLL